MKNKWNILKGLITGFIIGFLVCGLLFIIIPINGQAYKMKSSTGLDDRIYTAYALSDIDNYIAQNNIVKQNIFIVRDSSDKLLTPSNNFIVKNSLDNDFENYLSLNCVLVKYDENGSEIIYTGLANHSGKGWSVDRTALLTQWNENYAQ